MVCLFCWLLFRFGVNPDHHRENYRRCEAAKNRSPTGGGCVCFPMFTFCFHVQVAAEQHRTVDILSNYCLFVNDLSNLFSDGV